MDWRLICDIIGCCGAAASIGALGYGWFIQDQVMKIKKDMKSLNQAFDLIPFSSRFSEFNREFGSAVLDHDFNKGGSAKGLLDKLFQLLTELNKYHAKLSSSCRFDVDSYAKSIRDEISSCGIVGKESGTIISNWVNKIDICLCDEVSSRVDKIVDSLD